MTDKSNKKFDEAEVLAMLPPVPEGATFRPLAVRTTFDPHPYMITPRHLTGDSVYLDEDAIERSGAPCGVPGCQLGVREHESLVSVYVYVEDNTADGITACEGLLEWLKTAASGEAAEWIDGFAFTMDESIVAETEAGS